MRLLATAAILALSSLAVPAIAQVTGPATGIPDGAILEISATGRATRIADIATIRAGVVTQAPTAAAAMAENASRMAAVLDALKAAGIEPRDISTAGISLDPQYRRDDNKPPVILSYQASNTVTVRFRNIAKAGAILDSLVRLGVNEINGPTLSIDQPEAAQDEARADAVKRARARAELYAKAAGLSVVRILSIDEGGGAPSAGLMFRANSIQGGYSGADTQIVPGESSVSVTVGVRFLLK